jgi:hypothetical protein
VADLRPPKIENAPGLAWRKHKHRWEARWQPRTDLRQRGFPIGDTRLWLGMLEDITPFDIARIQDICTAVQNEMLVWGRGGIQETVTFDDTVHGLIDAYKTDSMSSYQKLRYVSRLNYNALLRRVKKDMGHMDLADIRARTVREMHEVWSRDGHIAMAHSLVTMLRTIVSFGVAYLENKECERLALILKTLKFQNSRRRDVVLDDAQVVAIINQAHATGWHSIALTNSFQFDGILRQKDVIGEYIPIPEKDFLSDVIVGNNKWGRGMVWQEIDDSFMLRHVTSKKQKAASVPLRMAPHVMAELARMAGVEVADLTRGMLPRSGPVVVREHTGVPWSANDFRFQWRKLADAVGIPKKIRNMDSRAGAISDAIEKGAALEHVRHAATHSDISTTQGYDRAQENNTIRVMEKRFGNKSGTDK